MATSSSVWCLEPYCLAGKQMNNFRQKIKVHAVAYEPDFPQWLCQLKYGIARTLSSKERYTKMETAYMSWLLTWVVLHFAALKTSHVSIALRICIVEIKDHDANSHFSSPTQSTLYRKIWNASRAWWCPTHGLIWVSRLTWSSVCVAYLAVGCTWMRFHIAVLHWVSRSMILCMVCSKYIFI